MVFGCTGQIYARRDHSKESCEVSRTLQQGFPSHSNTGNARQKVAGMASLRASDGLKEDLTPWLGGLYVEKKMRGQGIGNPIKQIEGKAIELGFGQLRPLDYGQSLSVWYSSLGWHRAGTDSAHGHPDTVMKTSLI